MTCARPAALPRRSLQLLADADVDPHALQRPLLLWFDALNRNTERSGHTAHTVFTSSHRNKFYLLVFEQQQFVVSDLEGSLLEPGPLEELRRFLTTPQQADLHNLTLIG